MLNPRSTRRIQLALLTLIALSARWFTFLFYGRIIDDAYISLRVMENIASGAGYAYHAGVPLQSSTSFLFTLIGAGLCKLFEPETALTILQASGATLDALVAPIIASLIYESSDDFRFTDDLSAFTAGAVYALMSTVVLVVDGGLETGFYTFTIALTFFCIQQRSLELTAIAVASVTLIRPDGGLLLVALSVYIFFTFNRKKVGQFALVAGVLLLPYAIFHLTYFPTLLPQTMIAKGHTALSISENWSYFLNKFFIGGAPQIFLGVTFVSGVFFCIRARKTLLLLFLGWGMVYGAAFSTFSTWWSWYLPPFVTSYAVAVGLGTGYCWDLMSRNLLQDHKWKVIGGTILVLVVATGFTIKLTKQINVNRSELTRGDKFNEKKIVEWLRARTEKTATVTTEKLGYVGFYSGRIFRDYPGLASQKVTTALDKLDRKINRRMTDWEAVDKVLNEVQPDYLILRQDAYDVMKQCSKELHEYGNVLVTNQSRDVKPTLHMILLKRGARNIVDWKAHKKRINCSKYRGL